MKYTLLLTRTLVALILAASAALPVMAAAPAITGPPVSQTVSVGQNVFFSVTATGTAPLTYQWRREGTNLTGATGAVLSLGVARADQAGNYTVVVSNADGSVTSAPTAALTVNTASGGTVVAWGANSEGQTTGTPSGTATASPVSLNGEILSGVTAIAAGIYHTVVLKSDGTVVAWGAQGGSVNRDQTNVPVGLSGVTAIAAGGSHTVALKNDGTLVAWGDNDFGQVSGTPTSFPATVIANPVTLSGQALVGVTAIAAGGYHTVALKNDGTLVAWGPTSGVFYSGQTAIPVGLSSVIAIAAGAYHNVALKSDGAVVAWGSNGEGQTAVPVAAQSGVIAVAAGGAHTVALKNDGTVVAWGFNGQGETNVPAGLSSVAAIAAGIRHTVALKTDGTVVAWGANIFDAGQATVPAGLNGVAAIAAGGYHTLALVPAIVPTITVQPSSQTVNAGQNTNFSVTATGTAPLNYQWRKDGTNIIGATNATYSITDAQTSQAGSYTVVVSNAGGSVVSSAAMLTVSLVNPTATFIPLGFLPGKTASRAQAVSGDGNWVVGDSQSASFPVQREAFRWSAQTGKQPLGFLPGQTSSSAFGVSSDGRYIVGSCDKAGFRWEFGAGFLNLGSAPGTDTVSPWGISSDGSIVVGGTAISTVPPGDENGPPVRWTLAGGMVSLGNLPGATEGEALAISADGQVIAGWSGTQAFRKVGGGALTALGMLPGYADSIARGVSSDGSVVVGESGDSQGRSQAFRWTSAGAMQPLGFIPGFNESSANAVSGDAQIVVGEVATNNFVTFTFSRRAFIWDATNGIRDLKVVLMGLGVDLTGWTLESAQGVSSDGATIVGDGVNPQGQGEGWVVRLNGAQAPVFTFGPQVQSTNAASISYDTGTGVFQYTAVATSSEDYANLPLTGSAATFITTSNGWTASTTVSLAARTMAVTSGRSAHVAMFLGVARTNGDLAFIGLAQGNNTGGGDDAIYPHGWYGTAVRFLANRNGGADVTTPLGSSLSSSNGSVYLPLMGGTNAVAATESFDAVSGVLTLSYNAPVATLTGYFNGTPVGSYSLAAWGSNPPVALLVYGTSGSGVAVPAGTATASDFYAGGLPASTQMDPFQWARRVASTTNTDDEFAIGMTLDSQGNAYVTGWFDGTNDFGGTALTNRSGGGQDIFVAKYAATGALQWARRAGGSTSNQDAGRGMGVDSAGNVYVTGGFHGTADFGSTSLTAAGNRQFFLAKYDSAGTVQWVQPSTGGSVFSPYVYGTGLTVDGAGNSYAVVYAGHSTFEGATPITFGATSVTIPAANGDSLILVKHDNVGAAQWAQLIGGAGNTYGNKVAVDAAGNVFLQGAFKTNLTVGTSNLMVSPGARKNMFLAKFNSAGGLTWVQQATGGDTSEGGVVVDLSGNVYVSGGFSGAVNFGGNSLTNLGSNIVNAFLVKYSSSGVAQWARNAGGTNGGSGEVVTYAGFYQDVALDGQGNVYATGVLGSDAVAPNGTGGATVVKYDPSGTLQWAYSAAGQFANPAPSIAAKTAIDSAGNCFLAGWHQTATTFGTTFLQPRGYWNFFLTKLAPNTQQTYASTNAATRIVTQPNSPSVAASTNLVLNFAATNVTGHQWLFNGAPIAGQTNATLSLGDLRRTNSGNYSVIVVGASGSLTSNPALVRVLVPQQLQPPIAQTNGQFRLLFNDGDGGPLSSNDLPNFQVHVSTNLTGTSWLVLTNGFTLTNGMVLFDDAGATNQARRFYRVIER